MPTYHEPPLEHRKQDNKRNNNESVSLLERSVGRENTSLRLPPVVRSAAFPPGHPCENFAIPPPPTDRKRIGPRRKSEESKAVGLSH